MAFDGEKFGTEVVDIVKGYIDKRSREFGGGMSEDTADEQVADIIVETVKTYVSRELAPLRDRIAELEARPVIKYLGKWEERREYPAGSLVTRGGSLWHANEATKTTPGDGPSAWVLVVKQGTFRDAS